MSLTRTGFKKNVVPNSSVVYKNTSALGTVLAIPGWSFAPRVILIISAGSKFVVWNLGRSGTAKFRSGHNGSGVVGDEE